MFTRLSNFTYGNTAIANVTIDTLLDNVDLLIHIQKYEEQCLRFLLGDITFAALITNVELDSDGFYKVKSGADDKWNWLLNGTSYTASALDSVCSCGCQLNNSTNRNWTGLVKKVATILSKDVIETLMAGYIFYNWSLNYRTLNVGVGEIKSDSKSGQTVSSKDKRVDAFNEYVRWAHYGFSCTNVSLSKFLEDHKTEFPEVNEICLTPLTYYDI